MSTSGAARRDTRRHPWGAVPFLSLTNGLPEERGRWSAMTDVLFPYADLAGHDLIVFGWTQAATTEDVTDNGVSL